MSNSSIDAGTISAFESFLKYGPLGLAGLLLVLVIVGLSIGKLSDAKASLLRTFLYVGAACFMAALAAQVFSARGEFELRITVLPQDMGSQSSFPPPIIRLNGQKVARPEDAPFRVSDNTSILVDVSDALGEFTESQKVATLQADALSRAQTQTTELASQVQALKISGAARPNVDMRALERSLKTINRTLQLP